MKKGLLVIILLISVLTISSCYYTPPVKLNTIRVFDSNGLEIQKGNYNQFDFLSGNRGTIKLNSPAPRYEYNQYIVTSNSALKVEIEVGLDAGYTLNSITFETNNQQIVLEDVNIVDGKTIVAYKIENVGAKNILFNLVSANVTNKNGKKEDVSLSIYKSGRDPLSGFYLIVKEYYTKLKTKINAFNNTYDTNLKLLDKIENLNDSIYKTTTNNFCYDATIYDKGDDNKVIYQYNYIYYELGEQSKDVIITKIVCEDKDVELFNLTLDNTKEEFFEVLLDYGFTKTVDEENRYVFTYEEISIELILDSQKMSQITIGLELTWDISR